jgi:hypothetical protein
MRRLIVVELAAAFAGAERLTGLVARAVMRGFLIGSN